MTDIVKKMFDGIFRRTFGDVYIDKHKIEK